jgi:hypothetical protein
MMQFGVDLLGAPTLDVSRSALLILNNHVAKRGLVQVGAPRTTTEFSAHFDDLITRYDVFCEALLG